MARKIRRGGVMSVFRIPGLTLFLLHNTTCLVVRGFLMLSCLVGAITCAAGDARKPNVLFLAVDDRDLRLKLRIGLRRRRRRRRRRLRQRLELRRRRRALRGAERPAQHEHEQAEGEARTHGAIVSTDDRDSSRARD